MKHLFCILNIIISILVFSSCKDEESVMQSVDEPCYTILVSAPDAADTRATYKEYGDSIAVVWEKGDVIILKNKVSDATGYSFVFRCTEGNYSRFVHYGEIPNATKWSGYVYFRSDPGAYTQVQLKNNECKEWLTKNVSNVNLTSSPKIPLLPNNTRSLLHLQLKSPTLFLGKSMLEIKGLKNNYTVTLGDDPSIVFADKDEMLDVYVTIPAQQTSIESGTVLKFYFYAYDNLAGSDVAEADKPKHGDEFHYYMKCTKDIALSNDKVVKLPLPNKPTHAAIQLGLGVKWATMNIGATSDQPGKASFGDYFPWGETTSITEPKEASDCYLYGKTDLELKGLFGNSDIKGKTKIINGVVYGDVATELWGDDWVLPTKSEAEALKGCFNTNKGIFTNWVEWATTSASKIPHTKTNGYYVYGKGNYSGKRIWFPAAGGVHTEKRVANEVASNDGCNGIYMTSTPVQNLSKAANLLMFNKNGYSVGAWDTKAADGKNYNFHRQHGVSVRPVRKK